MWKTYHLCLASHDEVMFRSQEDMNYGFNCLALAILQTESRLLCESFMSNHHHSGVQSKCPKEIMHLTRNAYSRGFNSKYRRKGRLGEKLAFCTELVGVHRIMTALNYIFRQPLHHGITTTPFAYANSSINVIFMKDLGKIKEHMLSPQGEKHKYLPSNISLPNKYRMDRSGLIIREDVIDTAYVESLYVTPRNFLYQMNAKSSEEWQKEQISENGAIQVVSIETIEPWADASEIQKMYNNECGRPNLSLLTDIELCELIDKQYVPRFSKATGSTIYTLSPSQRADIGNDIYQKFKYKTTVPQIRRCAIIK